MGKGAERNELAGFGRNVNRFQGLRGLLKFRGDFHHDVILVQTFVDVRDLALAEGVAERVVDVLDGNAETRSGVAVNDERTLKSLQLLVRVHIAEFGNGAEPPLQDGGPMRQIGKIVRLQGVLVLSATESPPNAQVLNCLQIQSSPRDFRGLRTDASNHLVDANFSFAERFELTIHPGGASTAAAAGERSDRVNSGVL